MNKIKTFNSKGEKIYPTEDGKIIGDLIDALRTNAKQFSQTLEYANHRSIYAVLNGDYSINDSLITRILKFYPHVNYLYLTGKKDAPMFKQGFETTFQKNLLGDKQNSTDIKLEMVLQQLAMVYGKLNAIEALITQSEKIGDEK